VWERIDVKKFWVLFFILWPIIAVAASVISPSERWWFPSDAQTPIGRQIDDLFYMILIIVAIVFIGTEVALGYVLWRGAVDTDKPGRALFTHGSHSLEVIWTIVPAGVLLFIALYQLDTWAAYRVKENYPMESRLAPVAEVTARQFEWRIRYPNPNRKFKSLADVDGWLRKPEPGDLYAVNELHVPTGRAVVIHLRSADVQHAFFVPDMRVKQDAVPGLVIPIFFEVLEPRAYEWVCAELCGWGHYKMKARVIAQPKEDYQAYLKELEREQFDDGVPQKAAPKVAGAVDAATSVAKAGPAGLPSPGMR
jgi:cytochrome c oxidase subunit II